MQLINKKTQQADKVDKAVETAYNPQLLQSYSDKNLITRSHKMRTELLKQMLFEEKVIEKNLNLLFKSNNGPRPQKTLEENTRLFKKKDADIPILMLMEKLKNMQEKELLSRMKKQSSSSTKVKLTENQRLKMLHKNLKNIDLYGELSSSQMFKS